MVRKTLFLWSWGIFFLIMSVTVILYALLRLDEWLRPWLYPHLIY